MWVLVEAQLVSLGVRVDRAGIEGTVCETYPSAALAAWGLGKAKQAWSELQSNFGFLTAADGLTSKFDSDDVCDAVVCALVARARDLELTIGPPDDALAAGRREGWIHVSCEPSDSLVRKR
jgi:hypothetical protein